MSRVAEVIEVNGFMVIFITFRSYLTTLIYEIQQFSDINFVGSMMSGVAEVIEVDGFMMIFITFRSYLKTLIDDI